MSWCEDFYPTFETCPECDGNIYCTYCYNGKIAIYKNNRNYLSKLLFCHKKFIEPENAKTRLLIKNKIR
jgi:hypothetical protein